MQKSATIRDVAQRAGVAISTVSLAFNDPARVRASTRCRVRRAADDLGYRRNVLAGSLRSGTSPVIGILLHDVSNPFYSHILQHIEQRAMEKGYVTLLSNSRGHPENELRSIASMQSFRAAGLIVHSITGDPAVSTALQALTMPVATFEQPDANRAFDFVGSENFGAAQRLTRHLIGLGHGRIAFLGGTRGTETADRRRAGYRAAMRQAGLAVAADLVVDAHYDIQTATAVTRRWILGDSPTPTAIVSASNFMAMGVLAAMQGLKLRCPEDISVVCFDKLPWTDGLHPKLTLVHQQVEPLAATTLDCLLSRISGDYSGAQREHRFPFLLETGESCRTWPPGGPDRKVSRTGPDHGPDHGPDQRHRAVAGAGEAAAPVRNRSGV